MDDDPFEGDYSDSTIEENSDEVEVQLIHDEPDIGHNEDIQIEGENREEQPPRRDDDDNNNNGASGSPGLPDDPEAPNEQDVEIVAELNSDIASTSGTTSCKRSRESDSEDEVSAGNVCPICMDKWTNAGEHRLVGLRCGHLFGNNCIVRWLEIGCAPGQRRCPQCNKRASKKDIRTLYVQNLQALDTAENEKLQEEINTLKEDKARLEKEIVKLDVLNKLLREELTKAQNTVQSLQNSLCSVSKQNTQPVLEASAISRMVLENTLEINAAGGCRVIAWNPLNRELYVSQSSNNNLFPGFSVRKVVLRDTRPCFGQSVHLHTKAIRDFAIRPQSNDLLLSVSLDKTAKILDLSNNSVVNKFTTSNPLWSCCWDNNNLNRFFVGSQNGVVLQFDSRQPNAPLQQLSFSGDLSPVTSVVSLPCVSGGVMPQGGILVSKLVSCWAVKQSNSGDEYQAQQLSIEGPFTSLCYNSETDHVLISRRPNARNPHACHMVCQLHREGDVIGCNVIHSFVAGTVQQQLTRPCLTKFGDELFVAAYVECRSCIIVWKASSGQIVATVKSHDPVKDICAVPYENKLWFASLSERTLRTYSMS